MLKTIFRNAYQENIIGKPFTLRIMLYMFLLVFLAFAVACAPSSVAPIDTSPVTENPAIETGETVQYHHTLDLEYAEPWLAQQAIPEVEVVEYSDALANQYAQPWLEQLVIPEVEVVEYSDALANQYAQPWLEEMNHNHCNGRLDFMYACKYGNYHP